MTTMTTRGRVMRICWIGCTLSAGFSSSVRHRGFRMPVTFKVRQQTDPPPPPSATGTHQEDSTPSWDLCECVRSWPESITTRQAEGGGQGLTYSKPL